MGCIAQCLADIACAKPPFATSPSLKLRPAGDSVFLRTSFLSNKVDLCKNTRLLANLFN